MKNILFLIPGSGSGSSMIFVERQINLIENEYVVHRQYINARKNPVKLVQNYFSVCRYLQRNKIDIIHSQYGSTTSIIGVLAALLFRKEFYCSLRGSDINEVFDRGLTLSRIIAFALSLVSAFYSRRIQIVSEPMRSRLLFPVLKRKVALIPSPVCDKKFLQLDKIECRKRLKLPLNEYIVAFYYNNDFDGKGGALFNEVIEKYFAPDEKPLFPLILRGINPDTMPLYLNAADVLLFPSKSEGSPNIIKEAALCSLPILTTRVGDIEQYIYESDGNYFIKDFSDIKKALDHYFQDYGKRSDSRDHCIKLFSNQTIKKRLIQFYL